MDRRLAGLIVLVLAVVAALAGNGRTKQLAGDPGRGPIPGPPDVGECVLEPFGWNEMEEGTFMPTYLSPSLGHCNGERHGEIVAVLPDGLEYEQSQAPGEAGGPDSTGEWPAYEPDPDEPFARCAELVDEFYGAEPDEAARPTRPEWLPSIIVGLDIVGPSPMQAADGQRWLACAAVGYSFSGPAPYRGTLKGVLDTLQGPAEFATCLVTVPQPDGSGGARGECTRPHQAEQFASVWSGETRLERAGLRSSCADLVGTMTGMPDPTADGRLELRVVEARVTTVQLNPATDEVVDTLDHTYACLLVATDDELTGPLLGLGEGRLPVG